ncbi:MAG: 2-amino-4-hydroxy-6-hydroxymethyldihydropteridine diphosphokinase [Candidatus Aquicultor sp.]
MAKAFLSLGSNLGDRGMQLRQAVRAIAGHEAIDLVKTSSVYETEPVGDVPQQNFYNIVIEITTDLSPHELLEAAHAVEGSLNRKRELHWGPRTIDVDILLYDNALINEEDLVIPHPEMLKRAFVLVPLLEIEPDIVLPRGGSALDYLHEVAGQKVEKIGSLM